MERTNTLTQDSYMSTLLNFSWPFVLISLINFFTPIVDIFWLKWFAVLENATVIVKMSSDIISFLQITAMAIATSFSIYINRLYARKEFSKAQSMLHVGIGLALILSLMLSFVGSFTYGSIVNFYEITDSMKSDALKYISIFVLGIPGLILSMFAVSILKLKGNSFPILKGALLNLCLNMILTPLLILYFKEKIYAAAFASLFALYMQCFFYIRKINQDEELPLNFSLKLTSLDEMKAVVKEILPMAISEIINSFSLGISLLSLGIMFSWYSRVVMECVFIGSYFAGFFQNIVLTVSGTIIPFVAQNFAIQKFENISKGVHFLAMLCFSLGLGIAFAFFISSSYLISLFTQDPEMIVNTSIYLKLVCIPCLFGISSFPYLFSIIGLGDYKGVFLLTLWSLYVSTLTPIYLVYKFMDPSIYNAALASSIGYSLTFFGFFVYFRRSMATLTHQEPILVSRPLKK